jgi:hypothetical protein
VRSLTLSNFENHPVFAASDAAPPLSDNEITELRILLASEKHQPLKKSQPSLVDEVDMHAANVGLAARVFTARRDRVKIFGADLFADPAYDILLDMFIVSERQQGATIGSVCQAAYVPKGTALRYIKVLMEKGYIDRVPHPHDKRSSILTLTPLATNLMNNWLTHFFTALNE